MRVNWGLGGMRSCRRRCRCDRSNNPLPPLLRPQALDITGCTAVTPRTLRRIAACCPRLQLLRLGGLQPARAMEAALPHVLPRITHVSNKHSEDSWEDLAAHMAPEANGADGHPAGPASGSGRSSSADGGLFPDEGLPPPVPELGPSSERAAAAAAAFGIGRLRELRWLIWPGVPRGVAATVAQEWPKVLLNPMPSALSAAVTHAAAVYAQKHPLDAREHGPVATSVCGSGGGSNDGGAAPLPWDPLDPMCALDEPLASLAGPAAWLELERGGSAAGAAGMAGCDPQGMSIAERFRQAYIDQDNRLREKERRAAEVLRRRQLRGSPALRAMTAWLDDGPRAV
eukprot:365571-Chlamydomonas_euryale.AAC.6